ncbi:plasmid mobilization protein [Empedobacter stercoris]|uniref:plasmid mobilization protein n=1 Tax=Empedobacter stercoris TaxID=1628248 RepID=UPI0039EB4452
MKNQSKKEVSLKFRVTELEKEIIENRAKTNGKTFSDYARFMLINGEIITISDKEKSILGGLANNINQLTKLFHQRKEVPAELLNELKNILIHLKNAYRRSS